MGPCINLYFTVSKYLKNIWQAAQKLSLTAGTFLFWNFNWFNSISTQKVLIIKIKFVECNF